MALFFKVADKELLAVRNKIFTQVGIPELKKNGFVNSPFSASWFGRNNLGDYTYELCRLSSDSVLEIIVVHIGRGDKWIQVYLNLFELVPRVSSIDQLQGCEGLQYKLMPNVLTRMRLRNEDYKGPPLLYTLFYPEHELGSFYSEKGYNREVHKLTELIKRDMANIDSFVKRWYRIRKINQTDWEGNILAATR